MKDYVSQEKESIIYQTANILVLFIHSFIIYELPCINQELGYTVMEEVCVIFKEWMSYQNFRVSMLFPPDTMEIFKPMPNLANRYKWIEWK